MKNLNEVINEASLLSDEEILMQSIETALAEDQFERIIDNYPINVPGKDAYGRTLEVGDWVVCVPPGMKSKATQTFGIVKRIAPKRITIKVKTNMGQITWSASAKKDKYWNEKFMDISVPCNMVFKITDKVEFVRSLT